LLHALIVIRLAKLRFAEELLDSLVEKQPKLKDNNLRSPAMKMKAQYHLLERLLSSTRPSSSCLARRKPTRLKFQDKSRLETRT